MEVSSYCLLLVGVTACCMKQRGTATFSSEACLCNLVAPGGDLLHRNIITSICLVQMVFAAFTCLAAFKLQPYAALNLPED